MPRRKPIYPKGWEKLMTTEEVAELMHVHTKTVGRWKREGKLPATRVGRRNLFKPEDVAALLETCRSDSDSAL